MAGHRRALGPSPLSFFFSAMLLLATSTGARLLPLEASSAEEKLNLRPIFGVLSQVRCGAGGTEDQCLRR